FASGWMHVRGARRRHAVYRGLVMSEHADWPGLNTAIDATGASRVIATHGYADVLARWLGERGIDAERFAAEYGEGHETTNGIGDASGDAVRAGDARADE